MTAVRRLPGYAWMPAANHSDRDDTPIDLLVVHYTGGLKCEGSLAWLRAKESGVSAHFTIARDGRAAQLVDLQRAAWHAGISEYLGERNCNARSIGVELCNSGLLDLDSRGAYWVNVGRQAVRYTGPQPVDGMIMLPDGSGIHGYWEPFTQAQIAALRQLVLDLKAQGFRFDVRGHHEIGRPVGRKIDPGPLVDLDELRAVARA